MNRDDLMTTMATVEIWYLMVILCVDYGRCSKLEVASCRNWTTLIYLTQSKKSKISNIFDLNCRP